MFSYHAGKDKHIPTARFRVVTDSLLGLKEATRAVEETAVAGEKMVATTTVFGYDRKRVQALKALGYTVGASLPGTVSLDGRRFDYNTLFKDLSVAYKHGSPRSYAKPGLYKSVEVEKAKSPKLKVRGYKREDRPFIDKFITQHNVLRGIASGVFDGNTPAMQLYRKTGFEESGRVPGWLQEGYVDEIFMTLKLE